MSRKLGLLAEFVPKWPRTQVGRCRGPRGDDYPVSAPRRQIKHLHLSNICTEQYMLYILLYTAADIKRSFIRGISAGSLKPTPHHSLSTVCTFFAKIPTVIIVSRSLSFLVSWYQELMDLRDASASKNLTTHMPNCQDNVTFVATKRKREKANREKCIQYQQMAVTSLCLITPKIYDPV